MTVTAQQDAAMLPLLIPLPGRAHDLPLTWDGRPVSWEGWQPTADVRICGRGRRLAAEKCSRCKSAEAPLMSAGRVQIDATVSLYLLTAFRCPGCGLDNVLDRTGDPEQWWDLDDTDYGDAGSTNPYTPAEHC